MMRITYTGRKYDNVSGYIWLYDKLFIIGDTHTRTHARTYARILWLEVEVGKKNTHTYFILFVFNSFVFLQSTALFGFIFATINIAMVPSDTNIVDMHLV